MEGQPLRLLSATLLRLLLGVASTAALNSTAPPFYFYECVDEIGDLNDTFYTRALRHHPSRVASPGAAELFVSHVACFVPVGFVAVDYDAEVVAGNRYPDWRPLQRPPPPRPPQAVVETFAGSRAFLFDQRDALSDFKHWRHERTHHVMTNCAPPRHRPGYDVCMPAVPERAGAASPASPGHRLLRVRPFGADSYTALPGTALARAQDALKRPKRSAGGGGCVFGDRRGPKRYRATFQGLNETRLRNKLLELDDRARAIVVAFTNGSVSCERRWAPCTRNSNKACDPCVPAEAPTDCDLLNATYVVAATDGSAPLTYRWLEALAAGAVPVPFVDGRDAKLPLPFDGVVDWEPCASVNADVGAVYRVAHNEDAAATRTRQAACWSIYDRHFASDRAVGDTILAALAAVADRDIPKNLPRRPRLRFRPPGGGRPGTLGRAG